MHAIEDWLEEMDPDYFTGDLHAMIKSASLFQVMIKNKNCIDAIITDCENGVPVRFSTDGLRLRY
jgi:hypothetical protein